MVETQKSNKELEQKMHEGKLEAHVNKKENDDENCYYQATRKKKGVKKNRNKKQNQGEAEGIQVDAETLRYFAHLKVAAPLSNEDYEKTQAELEEMKEQLQKEGDEELKRQDEDDDKEEAPEEEKKPVSRVG